MNPSWRGMLAVAAVVAAMTQPACTGRADGVDGTGGASAEARAASRRTPASASLVVANALREAEAADKAVLIEFGASWCKWCANFQAFIHSQEAGPIIDANYVVVNLTVYERDEEARALENPGAAELMEEWGGASSGLPFYVVLDSAGHRLANSNGMPDGGNIGYPVADEEIDAFMELIDRTAPRVGPEQRARLLTYLRRTAPKSS